jgi:hypothetical protein
VTGLVLVSAVVAGTLALTSATDPGFEPDAVLPEYVTRPGCARRFPGFSAWMPLGHALRFAVFRVFVLDRVRYIERPQIVTSGRDGS